MTLPSINKRLVNRRSPVLSELNSQGVSSRKKIAGVSNVSIIDQSERGPCLVVIGYSLRLLARIAPDRSPFTVKLRDDVTGLQRFLIFS